jgi:hypothetical protein
MEYRNIGTVKYWKNGTKEYRNNEILEWIE